jgi:hypothetical protein
LFWVKASDERANSASTARRERDIYPPRFEQGLIAGGRQNRPAAAGVGAVLYHNFEVCHKLL